MNLLFHAQKTSLNTGVTLLQKVDATNSPMKYKALKVLLLDQDGIYQEDLASQEACIVVLAGKATVTTNKATYEAIGQRQSIFDKIPTDSVYVGVTNHFRVQAVTANCKIAIAYAPTQKQLPERLIKGDVHQIEHRGKYNIKRTAQNILPDDLPFADKLLVVEVYTDAANWSSYPPHRHDRENPPEETYLEEIYYHEINPSDGFVFQHVYTDDRSLDETMTVENSDAVIVPKGYHPVGVPDGYDSYYLNVMGGPIRQWDFHNDPKFEWLLQRK